MKISISSEKPFRYVVRKWAPESDDGSSFTPGAWVDKQPALEVSPGVYEFELVDGEAISFDLSPP